MKLHNLNTKKNFKSRNLCLCIGNFIHTEGTSLDSIHQKVLNENIEPEPRSGNQEYLENILNKYL